MTIGSRIKELREAANLTQEQLAQKVGVTKSAIGNYEQNISSPKETILYKLIETLKCDANYIFQDGMIASENKFKTTPLEKDIIKKYRVLDQHGKDAIDYILNLEYDRCVKEPSVKYQTVLKPSYQCGLSAGTGLYVFDDVPSEQVAVPIEYEDIDFVIGVSGDSMDPTFNDGDKVMIKKEEVHTGEIGAFMVNGEAYIKELGEDRLISHNSSYEDIIFNDGMRIDCIGKVIGKL